MVICERLHTMETIVLPKVNSFDCYNADSNAKALTEGTGRTVYWTQVSLLVPVSLPPRALVET